MNSPIWDEEATVWVATSEDVSGLATEADTIEALSQKLKNHVVSADYAGAIAVQLTSRLSRIQSLTL